MTSRPAIHLTAGDAVAARLATADPLLGALIARVGHVDIGPTGAPFEALVSSVVAQQLSDKAATTIWNRVVERVTPTPEAFASAPMEVLRGAGLSQRKAEYVQGIAAATLAGDLDFDVLETLGDEEVIERLVALRGVGRWTAEMYLIFGLGRPDVLAVDDLGIRISTGRMLGLGRPAHRDEVAQRGELWRPHRTAACLWLWSDGS